MNSILYAVTLNKETHLWDITTEDSKCQNHNILDIMGGNQIWAMRDITKALLSEGYIATFKLDLDYTLSSFDEYEKMLRDANL